MMGLNEDVTIVMYGYSVLIYIEGSKVVVKYFFLPIYPSFTSLLQMYRDVGGIVV